MLKIDFCDIFNILLSLIYFYNNKDIKFLILFKPI